MSREIAQDVFWINLCNPSDNPTAGHGHLSVYLITGEQTVLIDTGAPYHWRKVVYEVQSVLGTRDLDYVFFTHPEIVHFGNVNRWLDLYPLALAIGGNPPFVVGNIESSRYQRFNPGDVLDLGGPSLEFVRPVILDLPDTLWAYEHRGKVLFSVDAWAYRHSDHQCDLLAEEMRDEVNGDRLVDFYDSRFPWLKFTRAEDLTRELERLFEERSVGVVAPSHGKVSYEPAWSLSVQKDALYTLGKMGTLAPRA